MVDKEIFLLRHGDTGRQGVYIGSTDICLSPEGIRQVRATGALLQNQKFDLVFCSPLLRCRQSWEQLQMDVPISVDGLLKEVDFGRWEGKSFAEIQKENPEILASWINDPHRFSFPGGESLTDFYQRVHFTFQRLLEEPSKKILLITHGGIIRHLLCLFLGISMDNYLIFDIQPGAYSSLAVYSEGGVLTALNIRG
jgi:alpha-ribazole phosphatase